MIEFICEAPSSWNPIPYVYAYGKISANKKDF